MTTSSPEAVAEMEIRILKVVHELKEALFTDLEDEVEGFAGADCSWCFDEGGNAYFWSGLSSVAADALINLNRSRRVFIGPVDPLLYIVDGKVPADPVATVSGLKRGYKRPHWIPVAICARPRNRS